jgi:alpha-galactosidase
MENGYYRVEVLGTEEALWRYTVKATGRSITVGAPIFEIGGQPLPAVLAQVAPVGEPVCLSCNITEYRWRGAFAADPDLILEVVLRTVADSPVVRFQYLLGAQSPRTLTKTTGCDALDYLRIAETGGGSWREVRVSEFDEAVHSFRLTELAIRSSAFEHELCVQGPILVCSTGQHTLLVACEHGSQVPDAFVHYQLKQDGGVVMRAVKGNYCAGQAIGPGHPYETIWLQIAAVPSDEAAMAHHYRRFMLHGLTLNTESRRPYIFYNTWNYQERNKWWNGRAFLDSMYQERILAEIEVAHRMGIEVFVLDTGWYEKTGDWRVNRRRFPDGLREVKERLDRYGMKLGLWFSPTQAAVSSHVAQEHLDCRLAWAGQVATPQPVWETEESFSMCLVSRYWSAFADELIRLVHEVGVTYFKWDAIGQYGCDDAGHAHGSTANSAAERADSYAFELGRAMSRVVDRVCRACPQAIIDFDITEGGRYVGLGFLSSGKYFLINNGPYYRSLDDPAFAPGGGMGSNVFVFPGPARARVCRAGLDYDRWIPSILFLTHYLPDDPESSQLINIASLILGQNGIWGDLLSISDEGSALFGRLLGLYKQVRDDITESDPVRTGSLGGSPEIHEKINPLSGRGAVVIVAGSAGQYTYITEHPVAPMYSSAGGEIRVLPAAQGRARLEAHFERPGASLVFFGAS